MIGIVGLLTRDIVDGGAPCIGGAAYHCGRALAVLGQPAVVATKYAAADHRLAAPLHGLGVRVAWRPAAVTGGFRIENRGDAREMVIETVGESWTLEEVRGWLGEALTGVDWVHAGALCRTDFPPETLAELARGRTLSLDGQGLVRAARTGPLVVDAGFDPEMLRHVTVLKLSEAEAAVVDVAALGVPEILVTLGSRGCVVYAGGREEHVPARPLDLADATGAGDAFVAAYLVARQGGQEPVAAARSATAVTHGLLSGWGGA